MTQPSRRRFVDCALLYQQQLHAEEHSLCCPPSIRSSSPIPNALIALLLDRADLPDGHFELVVARIARRQGGRITAVVEERSRWLMGQREAAMGQEEVEATLEEGEEVEVELRHVAWLVDEEEGGGSGGGKGWGLGLQEEVRAERKRKVEVHAAMQSVGSFVYASRLQLDAAQRSEDAGERGVQADANAQDSRPVADHGDFVCSL